MSGNFEVLPCGTQARLAEAEAEREALKADNERLSRIVAAANWNRAQEEHNALRAQRDALVDEKYRLRHLLAQARFLWIVRRTATSAIARSANLSTESTPRSPRKEAAMADFIKAITHLKAASRRLLNAIDLADDLRRTLAQAEPVQEPFALPCPTPKACREHCCSGHCIPRATSPQQAEPVQRKPLTEDEIEALFKGVDSEDKGRFAIVRGFARAIEAAHGIKGGGNG